ncbi:hypothetical protein CUMW_055910 [Citrus unshiu]|nr:hypothetical protein CUMW_055910 [Citrus unshiu]
MGTIKINRITSPFASADSEPSAYDVLQEYDFPVGILPKGVTRYALNAETGDCSFTIESYELKYESTISGVTSKDKLTNLKGAGVKVLILWLNIVEVIH